MGGDPAARLFISYSHADGRDQADRIVQQFGDDFEFLVDTNLRPGDQWHERIEEWMRTCSAAIILLSEQSLRSRFCQYEVSVLTSRSRATRRLPTDWLRLKLLPFRVGVSMADVNAVEQLAPTRLATSQIPSWSDDLDGIATELRALPKTDHAGRHARRLTTYFPDNEAALSEVAEVEYGGRLGDDRSPRRTIAEGLLARVATADPDEEDFLAGVNRGLTRLAEHLERGRQDEARELAWYTAAARVPYRHAEAIDAPGAIGRVVVVPSTSKQLARLMIYCAAASRWLRPRHVIDGIVAEVTLDQAGIDPDAVVDRVRDDLAKQLNVSIENFAAGMRTSVVERGLLPMAIVVPPEGSRLDPEVIRRMRLRLPWCTVLLVVGSYAELAGWRSEAEVMAMGDAAEADRNCRFLSAFESRVDDIVASVREAVGHV